MSEYSYKERKLLTHFGVAHMIGHNISAINIYRCAVENAFISGESGKYVESLRRCFIALNDWTVHRLTKEFDDLIDID